MCGIFGIISGNPINPRHLSTLAQQAQQRGRDSSGLILHDGTSYAVQRADEPLLQLLRSKIEGPLKLVFGHSRLITNGCQDNQPVVLDGLCVLHNGIIVNTDSIWAQLSRKRSLEIDSEVIPAIIAENLAKGHTFLEASNAVLSACDGVVACLIAAPRFGQLAAFSNNGSLYFGKHGSALFFASERFALALIGCDSIEQILSPRIFDIPTSTDEIQVHETHSQRPSLIPPLGKASSEGALLKYRVPELLRCKKCVLPHTMPFIQFDSQGICNYCRNYKPRNIPRPLEELKEIIAPYRRETTDCIIPFSGGRDSCFSLHLAVKELGLKPIAYTYDWGMVTDLGRRNISRMCSRLGVENIIVADDIGKKRRFIAKNLSAWLKSPNLGMISILTAGDKHFFRHIERIKRQTGIQLNLWGINPLEVTHFKSGFLGIPPDFEERRVYSHGAMKQLRYHFLRFKAMLRSPAYFNTSLWDTLSGEYYRSFTKKNDYFHVFDYLRWDEKVIDQTLNAYDWERAPDTKTTWRIGDGTAAFYNYIYHRVAGFTEHDTFRSNQIREGDISRSEALELVDEENQPRYPNIKWYLDAIGMDFSGVIKRVNEIRPLYSASVM